MQTPIPYVARALLLFIGGTANGIGHLRDGFADRARGQRGHELGIFMVLIFGAVALVTVSIVLLFGMDIAGDFSANIGQGDAFTVTNETFTASATGTVTYQVNRVPGEGDTVSLNDDETVYNVTASTELTESTDYEWYPDNGTVEVYNVQDSNAEFNITYSGNEHQYAAESADTTDSTGQAFELFGTSVLVIPAAAVLAVLIGGLVGAVTMVGRGSIAGTNSDRPGQR